MGVTQRQMLELVHRFGVMGVSHVHALVRPEGNRERTRQLLSQLVEGGHLVALRTGLPDAGVVYRSTSRGQRALDSSIQPTTMGPPLIPHALAVATIAVQLLAEHPGATWESEREIRSKMGKVDKKGARAHVPDGVLEYPDGRRVAVEVDLTRKEAARVERIFDGLMANPGYAGVLWYAVSARHRELLIEQRRKWTFDMDPDNVAKAEAVTIQAWSW